MVAVPAVDGGDAAGTRGGGGVVVMEGGGLGGEEEEVKFFLGGGVREVTLYASLGFLIFESTRTRRACVRVDGGNMIRRVRVIGAHAWVEIWQFHAYA